MNIQKSLHSSSPEDTISFGESFAKTINVNDIIGLYGELGSGKTQFVKGICKHFNVKDIVNSPTFVIVNEYAGADNNSKANININHFDLYRLKNMKELTEIGIESYVNDNSVCIIEWAELADEYFKGNLKKVFFEYGENENERIIKF